MSAVIQAIMATVVGGTPPGPPPPTALDAAFYGDDTIRAQGGNIGFWQVNSNWYNVSTFSGSAPAWNALTYKDGTSGHTYDFTNGQYMVSPNLDPSTYWPSNTISINFWFYPTVSDVQLLLETNTNDPQTWNYHYSALEITSMGNVKAKFWEGTPITSVNTVALNQWNHIYFFEDSQGGHGFELNGVPTTGNPTYTRAKPFGGGAHFAIGATSISSMGSTAGFQGKIGWLEIHDYVVGSTYSATKFKFVDPVVILNLDASIASSYSAPTGGLTIATNLEGQLSGWNSQSLSVAYDANILSTYAVGDTIIFQDNTTANITEIGDYGPTYIDIIWDTPVTGNIFPITLRRATWNSVGSAVQARLVNGPTFYNTGGVKAISFTGGSYATVPADVWFDQDFTIVAWVKVNSYANWSRIIDFGNGEGVNNVLFAVSENATGQPVISTSEFGNIVATGTTLPLNTWTHVVGRLSADGTASIWINGVQVRFYQGLPLPANVTRNYCYIGKSNWAGDSTLDGLIGELRIYRGALSDAKVYDDYYDTRSKYNPPTLALNLEATASYLDSTTSPTTWTDSVNNVPFTLYNGVGYNSGNGGYLTFQASSGRYAASTTGPALTTWAVETWTFWNGSNVGSNPCIISDIFQGGINYAIGTLDASGLQAGHFNGGWHTTPGGYTLPTTNTWYHIVGTYNGSDIKLYVNGVCVSILHDPGITPEKGSGGINLMRRWDNPEYWGGRLSVVRIYSGEMGAAEVKLKFDATKSQFGL